MTKHLIPLVFVLFLFGCGKGGDTCSPQKLQDPFTATGKVQLNDIATSGRWPGVANPYSQSGPSNSSVTNSLGFANQFQSPNANAGTETETDIDANAIIPAGTEFVAVVKTSCLTEESRHIRSQVHSIPWTTPRAMTKNEIRDLVERDECIVGISDMVPMFEAGMYTDPRISQETHLDALEASEANDIFLNPVSGITKDIVVAVIDSGVDLAHEDIRQNLWVNADEIPGNGIDDDHNGFIDDVYGYNFAEKKADPSPATNWNSRHGTHVAGLSAARGGNGVGLTGIMGQHLKIMALNVFGRSSGAYTSNIDNAIRYAADNGANIINMSLGGSGKPVSTESALTYALKKGVTVIVAAGNGGSLLGPNKFFSPASFSSYMRGVIAIGSIDVNSSKKSSFSNYGPGIVKLGAPGSDSKTGGLLSTLPKNAYGRLQGTSMASPVVAGAVGLAMGLVKSRGRSVPLPGAVENILMNSGKAISALTSFFNQGKILNLKNLARTVDQYYPVSGMGTGDSLGDGSLGQCQ